MRSQTKHHLNIEAKYDQKIADSIGHQKVLKEKLSAYLKIVKLDHENHRNIILADALTSHGFCYGFTLTRAAFQYKKMLEWWEAVLKKIAAWKGTQGELEEKVHLPQSKELEKLEDIFFKCLNYIVYHYATTTREGGKAIKGLNQPVLLQPANPFYQISIQKEAKIEVVNIIDKICAPGFFSDEQLLQLINLKFFKNNVCFLHSLTHILQIGYDDIRKKWFIYDSNYPIEEMTQFFEDTRSLIIAIRKQFRPNTPVGIDLIAFSDTQEQKAERDKQFQEFIACYESMVMTDPIKILKNNSLKLMMKYRPQVLTQIISMVRHSDEKEQSQIKKHKIIDIFCESIKSICKKRTGETVLSAMIDYSPQCVIELIELASTEKNYPIKNNLISAIIESLTVKYIDNKTGTEVTGQKKFKKKFPQYFEWLKQAQISRLNQEPSEVKFTFAYSNLTLYPPKIKIRDARKTKTIKIKFG